MLFGEYYPSFNGKNRTSLAKKLREEIAGDEIILSRGVGSKCIFGFSKKEWEEAAKQELTKPLSDPEGQRIRRAFFTGAAAVELDEQGRFVIPEFLIKYADVKEKIVIAGVGDHFEIWNKDLYEKSFNNE